MFAVKFSEFHARWKDAIRLTTSPGQTRALYFADQKLRYGLDCLPEFLKNHGEEWAVRTATIFEQKSTLAAQLNSIDLAKFRMIADRHMVNLSSVRFDETYHKSSDERSLFLIHNRLPPERVSAALMLAKNASIDLVSQTADGHPGPKELALILVMSTIFMIEQSQIMRAYIYFASKQANRRNVFVDIDVSAMTVGANYKPPTQNNQMSTPDASLRGMVDLF